MPDLTCPGCGTKVPIPKAASPLDNIISKKAPGAKLREALKPGMRPNPGVRLPRGETRFMKHKDGGGLL